ncbi:MAG: YafY family transcriptional regulator [Alphaproteobacteria bacterium]|nr:YafY family transcriptional regulator [Alphaproteobacteria bacterium]MDE1987019.1 YafY family transcriptional regulator [Alphaproteobacteria bacterium]MDE2164188.1 YafY family transcriptional regulator [Alphaproteobacteria bacterium]MDE2266091.1 YafY family transcriptional regulator [Alphaproteobacteria bacterium]MDE2499130.1 YafY family transcriptional regulator [Alphaproteobacteria bacterium]
MLASRLLSILMLLQTRGRMTAPELAEQFEVSVRTIYRDIDQLSAAGIPVYADRGRAGGFQLLDGYRTKLTGLTEAEAETLFLAGLPGPAAELGLADLLSTARLKLMAALPAGTQAERIAARFHLDPAGWFSVSQPAAFLPEIARAVWNERYLKIRYRRGGEIHARKLGPLGLVLKGGIWYLIAQRGKEFRTYRVSNVAEAETLDQPYMRPKNFDLAAYWTKSSREFETNAYRESVTVRLSPRGRSMLDLMGPYVVEAATKTASPPDKRGWVRCTIPLESIEFGIRELLRLGEDVEVLAPPTVRSQMAQTLRTMLTPYGGRR